MKIASTLKALTFCIATLFFISCKKDSPSLPSKQYVLYNYSSGNATPAGTFTIQQVGDSNAALSIQLSSEYLVPNTNLQAYLTISDTSNLIFSTLGIVNGNSGRAIINPVMTNGNNQPVKYNDLIGMIGYTVKVLNNSNIQASGSIR
jgi:hypothetical protein